MTRRSNLDDFYYERTRESCLDSGDLKRDTVYVGYVPVFRAIRMEWIDKKGNLQVREDPCELDGYFPNIKKTINRMYSQHLIDQGLGLIEYFIDRQGVVSIETCSEKCDRGSFFQNLLIGIEEDMGDDWIRVIDVSSCFDDS